MNYTLQKKKKRMIITMVLAGILGMANAQNTSSTEGHVQSATAISRVMGDGRKVETVVLQYDTPHPQQEPLY